MATIQPMLIPLQVEDAWQRQPGESSLWYARFEIYRLLGPERTVNAAFQVFTGKDIPANGTWRARARRWCWAERAARWDDRERERLRLAEAEHRRAAREERLLRLAQARDQAWAGIQAANLAGLAEAEARSLLGSLRILFMEALKMERLELGEPTTILEELAEPPAFTADEYARAAADLDQWRRQQEEEAVRDLAPPA